MTEVGDRNGIEFDWAVATRRLSWSYCFRRNYLYRRESLPSETKQLLFVDILFFYILPLWALLSTGDGLLPNTIFEPESNVP